MSEDKTPLLADRDCIPCKGGIPPLRGELVLQYQNELAGGWEVIDERRLEKSYKFQDFRQALNFTMQVGELAESVGHHPDIFLAWGLVKITIWTHKIGGLSESDFILAAKVDRLLQQ
jgi:4a-hydroxytetrahydrobiopterin dehydratase